MASYLTRFAIPASAVPVLAALPAEQKPIAVQVPGSEAYKVQHELKKAEIIPTVINEFLPSFVLDAKWSSDNYADLGNTLKVDAAQDEPSIKIHPISGSSALADDVTYTITITDPDAPSRDDPKWSEICHFIATGVSVSTNISDSSSESVTLSGLKEIMPYKAPGPPPKTGKHRYVFLVFAPANGTSDSLNLTKPADRKHWGTGKEGNGVRDWALDNGLEPVAANFIYAQNEEQ
ncbi:Uu.00g011440.m01.CDS01 [Anthostomella pinea]|uniref:Uu.00g011440.m01.CDS01 n=1 Tax=Anthostomella pinea TaxID=933095 RepID=A0AAI8YQ58_9PEZI|nr:Uu.00g011440.m01.CDS01 [Anthostomella pinea]